jgi:hypothetical protein
VERTGYVKVLVGQASVASHGRARGQVGQLGMGDRQAFEVDAAQQAVGVTGVVVEMHATLDGAAACVGVAGEVNQGVFDEGILHRSAGCPRAGQGCSPWKGCAR